MDEKLLDRLRAVVASVLQIDEDEIDASTSPQNTPAWTSLLHLMLLAGVEQEFGIQFTMDEMAQAQSVAEIATLIERKQ